MKRIPYAGAEPALRKPWPQEQLQFVADLRARKVSCDAIADALVEEFGRAECANEVAKAYRYHKRGVAA